MMFLLLTNLHFSQLSFFLSLCFQHTMSESPDVAKCPSSDNLDMGLSVQPITTQHKTQQGPTKVENVHGKVLLLLSIISIPGESIKTPGV